MPTLAPDIARPAVTPELVRTARTTGLLYLALALTGLFGFLLIRGQLFVDGDPEATLVQLRQHESLARLGVVMELAVVITQALVALWFFRLFRGVNTLAAASIAAFGLINSVAIVGSAAMIATALDVSHNSALTTGGGAAGTVQLLYVASEHLWLIGGIFFGLWLIPMGWLARQSGWMPPLLGQILMIGGVGYVANTLLSYTLPDVGGALDLLVIPATIGELWMVGYLCLKGVRRS